MNGVPIPVSQEWLNNVILHNLRTPAVLWIRNPDQNWIHIQELCGSGSVFRIQILTGKKKLKLETN